jgi:hypothetical protein
MERTFQTKQKDRNPLKWLIAFGVISILFHIGLLVFFYAMPLFQQEKFERASVQYARASRYEKLETGPTGLFSFNQIFTTFLNSHQLNWQK